MPGIGELAGGSAREERLGRLEGRMAAKGMADAGGMEWYSDLRRFGTVPHAGCGNFDINFGPRLDPHHS